MGIAPGGLGRRQRSGAPVTRVGLTGGIGSGKSEVARLLESHGAIVVDADVLAREALAPGTPGLARVVEAFGEEVLAPDGSLDRERLGKAIFADPSQRATLEAIVHPYVAVRSAEMMRAAPEGSVVVYDVPLLVENELAGEFDIVVVVDAEPATRLDRLVRRGLPETDARARMAAQASREARIAVADVLVPNDGSREELADSVAALWRRLAGERASGG